MGLLGLLQGHAKPLIERHFLALAGIVTTFYPYLEATPSPPVSTAGVVRLPATTPEDAGSKTPGRPDGARRAKHEDGGLLKGNPPYTCFSDLTLTEKLPSTA